MILRSEEKLEAGDKLHILKGLFAKTQKGSKFTQRKIESLPQNSNFLISISLQPDDGNL